ncbi:hypothetical protein AMS62_00440 [Bacillus sp. FJAT-18019]|uniref:Uncharacterized protein n=1 Tax=Paenibacillus solani TaxID=1705565 RepID=A0A0M1P3U5_9BACL|nr:hypothetical protein [Paenibacillus solani]KOP63863.1 hypothetical protein AMS62_00440 [Bacillus sp. FJAT-18019]KOR88719.1 hypothetical protein AM231_05760 [Paenibacillus solani]
MKTSSFLCGVILGAVASRVISRKNNMSISSMMKNTNLGQFADTAISKIQGTKSQYSGSSQESMGQHDINRTTGVSGVQTSTHTKSANLKQVKDFIRNNPEVKSEVEQILKETHTVIPGL